ncbi:hypothetical protein ACHAWF_005704 [Thalassiosira exigua]
MVAVTTAARCLLLLLLHTCVRAFVSPSGILARAPRPPRCPLAARPRGECERRPDGMPMLPADVVQYTQVPKSGAVFAATTIPSGLTKRHTTKEGTWGVIRVSRGLLEYTILEPSESVHVLDARNLGVIEPTMLHQVKALSDDVEFVVEFWRVPGTGVVDEKREGLE